MKRYPCGCVIGEDGKTTQRCKGAVALSLLCARSREALFTSEDREQTKRMSRLHHVHLVQLGAHYLTPEAIR